MDSTTLETVRPVIVQYTRDVDPTPEHPAGFLRGATFEVPTPEQAWAAHPEAVIIRYADGASYHDGKARKEVRERDRAIAADSGDAPVKRSKGRVRRQQVGKGTKTRKPERIIPAAPEGTSDVVVEVDGGELVSVEVVETETPTTE